MPKPLTTFRLLLREPAASDAAAIVRHVNNYAVSKNTSRIPFPYGREDADELLSLLAGKSAPVFAIIERTAPESLIGIIGLDEGDGEAELGYWLAEPYWRRGLMGEAAAAVVAFAFSDGGFTRLTSGYHLGNEASRRILMGLGFVATGKIMAFSRAQGKDISMQKLQLLKAGFHAK
jgi:RimJ/RimL family protein N-acetyltransferase